ncbi:MAG: GntR family transcriptional regulator [Bacteroidetes bacterium RBG_13_43_22]|nr:MAG: GntR family transcriptional regulator [Bacteroidetes bacterium RBG_13_43_22]
MNFTIDPYSPIPLHYQIEQFLRELIKKEEYISGKLLPTEVELAKRLGTSRNTVRQAINKLVSEGLLIRKKGFGTIVLQHQLYTKVSNWFSFTKELQSRGMKVKNYDLNFQKLIPPIEVSIFFKISQKTEVYKLERLRGNEKLPFVYFISYFNPSIGLTENEDFSIPLYEMLQNKYKIVAKTSNEELMATRADKFLAEKLSVGECDPILVRKRFVYDKKKMPIEFNIGYYIGEKFTYILESERKF